MREPPPYARVPLFDPHDGVTLLEPEKDAPGYWAGAPSAWVDEDGVYLSVRHRRPIGRGRGWKSTIYHTTDAVTFEEVWQCTSSHFGTESIERCALCRAPGGSWRYYVSYVDPADRRWRIDLLEADSIAALNPHARIPVLTAAGTDSEGVKDPVILLMDGVTYLFAGYGPRATVRPGAAARELHGTGNVFTTGLVLHPTGLWTSPDGRRFEFQRDILWPGEGWDGNVTRLSTIMPTNAGYVLFYDGRTGRGDTYEDRVGIASTQDLINIQRHSEAAPALEGVAGSRCLRYLDYARVGNELIYYYETARASGAHELRVCRVRLA
ncbi:MAG: hypothetical protein FJ029_15615 [Actinobacteria bacterium]|nr:hypothetical protein [Actinomycetota bacterium]